MAEHRLRIRLNRDRQQNAESDERFETESFHAVPSTFSNL